MDVLSGRQHSGYLPIDEYSQTLDHNHINNTVNNSNTHDFHKVYGYKKNIFRLIFFYLISIILLGIPFWFTFLSCLRYKKCFLKDCDIILIINNQGQSTFLKINKVNANHTNLSHRIFCFQHVRYIWSENLQKFIKLENPFDNNALYKILKDTTGLKETKRQNLLKLYGNNTIEVKVKSYWTLFRTEIINPFYLFQCFSITLWSLDDYYYYAGCILLLSGISIISSLHETRAQSITLKNLIDSTKPEKIQIVNKEKQIIDISPDDLVPGDILYLPPGGLIMPCDAILLTGTCIVNESMLTGESVPVMKSPPNHNTEKLSFDNHKRHLLFAGTDIVQTRYTGNDKVLAKVLRTGFNTVKGDLIKSILFPQAIGFQFYNDSIKFITALFCIAILGMIYCVRIYMQRHEKFTTILLRTLDVITIVVPPALPMAMTAGTIYSQARLKKKGIYCISPPRINVCGKIKLVCFDKTGTLTDDNLTLYGIIECKKTGFDMFVAHPTTLNPYTEIIQAMATCHSLSNINDKLSGDPLDIEIFKSVQWDLIEPGEEHVKFDSLAPTIVRPKIQINDHVQHNLINFDSDITPYLIGIIKCFQFSSETQCMTVVTQVFGHEHMKVFTKGAPEKIKKLCIPSTIPSDFYNTLNEYTSQGYRVLGLAYRELLLNINWREVDKMNREDFEKRLIFLGFIVLENSLKPESKPCIEDLHAANIRTVMITGDNLMTAISVARDCRMVLPDEDILLIKTEPSLNDEKYQRISIIVDCNKRINHLVDSTILNTEPWKYKSAIDGAAWSILNEKYPHLIHQIIIRGVIFARFNPEQKSQVVSLFQQMDYIVAMVGDGANDCSALRMAHVGVSLSQAEASVAAPFTSNIPNISCIKQLALEGRCALVTSFGIFKYMTLYSLIQFCTILILYSKCSALGNVQFLYIDLVITTTLAFTMGNQGPSDVLVLQRPKSSLISLHNLIPMILQVITCATVQIFSLIFLMSQNWYNPVSVNSCKNSIYLTRLFHKESSLISWENTITFLISSFQYIIIAIVYCKGKPFRQSIYKNYPFVFFSIILIGFTSFLLVHPIKIISDFFEIQPLSTSTEEENFRLIVLTFPLAHLFVALFIEFCISERVWFKKFLHFITRKSKPKNKYKLIENELENNQNWLDVIYRNENNS